MEKSARQGRAVGWYNLRSDLKCLTRRAIFDAQDREDAVEHLSPEIINCVWGLLSHEARLAILSACYGESVTETISQRVSCETEVFQPLSTGTPFIEEAPIDEGSSAESAVDDEAASCTTDHSSRQGNEVRTSCTSTSSSRTPSLRIKTNFPASN